ncbi:MAG: phosphoenolpyruvate--protein phosphotransferase [Lachnospiraceae bacterium]|nr:phosphoenolpyruvate--protein phosphotransferase [Lachnospiraceae bacterium]
MLKLQGKPVQEGIAIGKIRVIETIKPEIERRKTDNVSEELIRVSEAVDKAKQQLSELYDNALKKTDEKTAAIFEVHKMMLEDGGYLDGIRNIVEGEKVNAEYAVRSTGEKYAGIFLAMDDENMRNRAGDMRDISDRVILNLMGKTYEKPETGEPFILVADDLTPSQTVNLNKEEILAIVTVKGSVNSHSAILARNMEIPALIQAPIDDMHKLDGKTAVVDAYEGSFITDPSEELIKEKELVKKEKEGQKEELSKYRGLETKTRDGRRISLYANAGSIEDIKRALKNDAEGIGLFRSEFLFIGKDECPTEDEQFQVYKQALCLMGNKKVIIRTCDIGADKQADYLDLEKEENPALGYRGIRICLDRREFFKTQLKALYRASVYGNLSVMYPMITSALEVDKIKAITEEVKEELGRDGISYDEGVEQGIMIETPAAALIADELAAKVDFFSVGTNDLTQYTLAMDRQNPKLESFADKYHPAVFKLIEMAARAAMKNNIPVGICGELAADTSLSKRFADMGIDELSVSPGKILGLRKKISTC